MDQPLEATSTVRREGINKKVCYLEEQAAAGLQNETYNNTRPVWAYEKWSAVNLPKSIFKLHSKEPSSPPFFFHRNFFYANDASS